MERKTPALIALCAALTAAGAFIRIPLWPVAITLQTFFVLLSGIMLGPRYGALSQLVYLIVGLLGLPVFSGGGGLAYLMQPSFGYLLGFVAAPAAVGLLVENKTLTPKTVFPAALAGTLVIYCIGMPYLAVYMHLVLKKPDAVSLAVKTGALVFLPGDLLKCLILSLLSPRLRFILHPDSRI
ncbi:MAG TPA: biotin transporter BioY [Desulfomonilia bacterium]|nr:biotin transporter BioY [Desulfomonilia bacterium]